MGGVVHVLQKPQSHVPHQPLCLDRVIVVVFPLLLQYSQEHLLAGVLLKADQALNHDLQEVGQLV